MLAIRGLNCLQFFNNINLQFIGGVVCVFILNYGEGDWNKMRPMPKKLMLATWDVDKWVMKKKDVLKWSKTLFRNKKTPFNYFRERMNRKFKLFGSLEIWLFGSSIEVCSFGVWRSEESIRILELKTREINLKLQCENLWSTYVEGMSTAEL